MPEKKALQEDEPPDEERDWSPQDGIHPHFSPRDPRNFISAHFKDLCLSQIQVLMPGLYTFKSV